MSSLDRACEAAQLLERITKPERGGIPAFRPSHVLRALRLLASRPLGRPLLARELSLGEAPVRTMLSRLEHEGLVSRSGRGRSLTGRGAALLEGVERVVRIREIPVSPFGGDRSLAAIVEGVPGPTDLTGVYTVRDRLVEAGCRRCLIGRIAGGKPVFPGAPGEVHELLAPHLEGMGEGLLIVVPPECEDALMDALIQVILDYCSMAR